MHSAAQRTQSIGTNTSYGQQTQKVGQEKLRSSASFQATSRPTRSYVMIPTRQCSPRKGSPWRIRGTNFLWGSRQKVWECQHRKYWQAERRDSTRQSTHTTNNTWASQLGWSNREQYTMNMVHGLKITYLKRRVYDHLVTSVTFAGVLESAQTAEQMGILMGETELQLPQQFV